MGKRYYITTAIPYANAKPHIGNAMDYLIADITSRYQRQNGKEVRFQAGVDEHGNKIAAKAAENNMTAQEFVDNMFGNFQLLIKALNVEYTDFLRTSSPNHKQIVQYIWQKLQPHIYKGSYEGWYCIGHEAFFTDKEVEELGSVCSEHNMPFQRLSEENYYLRMSDFTDKIREAVETNRLKILPEFRKNEFLQLIKNGMPDVSISRPKKNLSWGIEVPGDPSQVMYVWLDALTNYITVLGYPNAENFTEYWPANVQVIGKDILRFHAGIWPAILLGLDLPLPKMLLVHGHINVAGTKMSKSIGNIVDPLEVIENYGVDAFRYFFARHIPTQDDGDFTWEKFENAYNSELGNDLGNLVQRVAAMINRYQSGVIGEGGRAEHDMGPYHQSMESYQYDKAIDAIWQNIRTLNQYLDQVKPWQVAKQRDSDAEAAAHLEEILGHCVSSLRQIADMLWPFMPSTSEAINATFASNVISQPVTSLFPKKYLKTPDPHAQKV